MRNYFENIIYKIIMENNISFQENVLTKQDEILSKQNEIISYFQNVIELYKKDKYRETQENIMLKCLLNSIPDGVYVIDSEKIES